MYYVRSACVLSDRESSSKAGVCGGVHAHHGVQVYHALRCNAVDAALEAAAPQALAFPGGHHISGELQGWLNAWHAGGRVLPASTASEIERQAVGVVESRELEKQGVRLLPCK